MANSQIVGNGSHTIAKQEQFASFMRMHVNIAAGVVKHHGGRYCYVEMNAGPGMMPHEPGYLGTPLRALPLVFARFPTAEVVLCENDADTCRQLRLHIDSGIADGIYPRACVSVRHGDHANILPAWISGLKDVPYGLLFHDPNGVPSFDVLEEASRDRRTRLMDIAMYFTAAGLKRNLHNGVAPLDQQLRAINKRVWLIREPVGKHQWSFVIGTNWERFPIWSKAGFHTQDSQRGTALLDELSYPEAERRLRHQLPLLLDGAA